MSPAWARLLVSFLLMCTLGATPTTVSAISAGYDNDTKIAVMFVAQEAENVSTLPSNSSLNCLHGLAENCTIRSAITECISLAGQVDGLFCDIRIHSGTYQQEAEIELNRQQSSRRVTVRLQPIWNTTGTVLVRGRGIVTPFRFLSVRGFDRNGESNVHLLLNNMTFAEFAMLGNARGGVLYALLTRTDVDNCTFLDNQASVGGALFLDATNRSVVRDSTFFDNRGTDDRIAFDGLGGAIYWGASSNVRILTSTFLKNNATSQGGGVMFNLCQNVTVSNCSFLSNAAPRSGGVAVQLSGNVRITKSTFANNDATVLGGGAIGVLLSTNLILDRSVFQRNTAFSVPDRVQDDSSDMGSGGAIILRLGSARVTHCNFTDNVGRVGGALYAVIQTLSVAECIFERQVAAAGGGVAGHLSTLRLNDSHFVNNSAVLGAGVRVQDTVLTVHGCSFLSNIVTSTLAGAFPLASSFQTMGGAIYAESSALLVQDSAIHNSLADFGGGAALIVHSVMRTINTTVSGCNATKAGGAFFVSTASLSATGLMVSGNVAPLGGGVIAEAVSTFVCITCDLQNNRAYSNGAATALYLSSTGTLISTHVANNAADVQGGGIYADPRSVTTLNGAVVTNNKAFFGAGVACTQGVVTVTDSVFEGNIAISRGGAVYAEAMQSFTTRGSTFRQSIAFDGGAISLTSLETQEVSAVDEIMVVANSTFDACRALGGDGGALHIDEVDSAVLIEESEFTDCGGSATAAGGAVAAHDLACINVLDTSFAGCTARNGGAAQLKDTMLSVWNSSFVGNIARANGGAISMDVRSNLSFLSVHPQATGANNIWAQCPSDNDALLRSNCTDENSSGRAACTESGPTTFENNSAPFGGGGCVFWQDTAPLGMANRVGLAENVFVGTGNSALYGAVLASVVNHLNASVVQYDSQHGTNQSSGAAIPLLRLELTDAYSSRVRTLSGDFVVALGLEDAAVSAQTIVTVANGSALYEDSLVVTGTPGTTGRVGFTTTISSAYLEGDSEDIAYDVDLNTTIPVPFRSCALGETLTVDPEVCTVCEKGKYGDDPTGMSRCNSCPSHSTCEGAEVLAHDGYWKDSGPISHVRIRSCLYPDACKGTVANGSQCEKGSKGPLCAVCQENYFSGSSASKCKACTAAQSYSVVYTLGAFAIFLVGAMCAVRYSTGMSLGTLWTLAMETFDRSLTFRVRIKVLVTYYQTVSFFYSIFAVSYGQLFSSVSNGLNSLSTLSFDSLLAIQCYTENSFYYALVFRTVFPAVLLFLLWLAYQRSKHKLEAIHRQALLLRSANNGDGNGDNIASSSSRSSAMATSRETKATARTLMRPTERREDASFSTVAPPAMVEHVSPIAASRGDSTTLEQGADAEAGGAAGGVSPESGSESLPKLMADFDLDAALSTLRARYSSYALLLTYIVLPGTSLSVFRFLACDSSFNEGSYLRADYSIRCEGPVYRAYLAYVLICLLVYPIGIPTTYFFLLYRARHDLDISADAVIARIQHVKDLIQLQQMQKQGADARKQALTRKQRDQRVSQLSNTGSGSEWKETSEVDLGVQGAQSTAPERRSSAHFAESIRASATFLRPDARADIDDDYDGEDEDDDAGDNDETDEQGELDEKRGINLRHDGQAEHRQDHTGFNADDGESEDVISTKMLDGATPSLLSQGVQPRHQRQGGLVWSNRGESRRKQGSTIPLETLDRLIADNARARAIKYACRSTMGSHRRHVEQRSAARLVREFNKFVDSVRPLSFLYEAYRPALFYMEVVECLRRHLLTSMLVMFAPGSTEQVAVAMFFLVLSIILYSTLEPFTSVSNNSLILAALWSTFFLLFAALLIQVNELDGNNVNLDILMVVVMLLGPAITVGNIGWVLSRTRQALKRSTGGSVAKPAQGPEDANKEDPRQSSRDDSWTEGDRVSDGSSRSTASRSLLQKNAPPAILRAIEYLDHISHDDDPVSDGHVPSAHKAMEMTVASRASGGTEAAGAATTE